MMSIVQASEFFVGSILFMLGLVTIFAGIVAINNILHRFWKPVRLGIMDVREPVVRFATEEELRLSQKDK